MIDTEQTAESMALEVELDQHAYQAAYDLYCQSPDWVVFFRQVLGLNGIVRRCFPTREALSEFERTDAYAEIQQMLKRLRERKPEEAKPQERIRVITVRLPESLHEALQEEAHEYRTSVNKLCISKLLQFIDNDLVPSEKVRKKPEVDA